MPSDQGTESNQSQEGATKLHSKGKWIPYFTVTIYSTFMQRIDYDLYKHASTVINYTGTVLSTGYGNSTRQCKLLAKHNSCYQDTPVVVLQT